jgi:hypothetical protein
MSTQDHPNTFQYCFTDAELAERLARHLTEGGKMLHASGEFYGDPSLQREMMGLLLKQFQLLVNDARSRLAELARDAGREME